MNISHSESKVFIPRGPSSFSSAMFKASQAFSTVNSSGAYKSKPLEFHLPITIHSFKHIKEPFLLFVTFTMTYHHHGNGEVGSELVVTPGAGGSTAVFVNAPLMNQLWVLLVGITRVLGHME